MLMEPQKDILTELVNIGVGRAAFALSEMVDSRVGLKVPHVHLAQLGLERMVRHSGQTDTVSVVLQPFSGSLSGTAALLIPCASARSLVAILTGTPSESSEIDVEREGVITEVGNIVINGVLGSLGNLAALDVTFGLPRYEEGLAEDLLASAEVGAVVAATVLFEIRSHAIHGELAILFDLPSLDGVWELLDPSAAMGHA